MVKHEVSLHKDSAGMIYGAHILHTWTVWKTTLPAGTCFLFNSAVHKPPKQNKSHRVLDSIMSIVHEALLIRKIMSKQCFSLASHSAPTELHPAASTAKGHPSPPCDHAWQRPEMGNGISTCFLPAPEQLHG